MESKKDVFALSTRSVENNQPVAMVSQLMRDAASMSSMDEVFLWLAQKVVQRLDVHTLQIWVMQSYSGGQNRIELRSFAGQNPELSQLLTESAQFTAIAELMFREKHGSDPLPITTVFAPYQATVFAQQNVRYWAGYFHHTSVWLSPTQNRTVLGQVPTLLSLAVSLFLENEPSPRFLRSIKFLFEQAIRIATSRGLLSSTIYTTPQKSDKNVEKPEHRVLFDLIPHRTHELQVEQGMNPFASAMVILDKRSRKFYFAIDDRKSVIELLRQEFLEQNDLPEILKMLLEQKYIQFSESDGKSVESSSILKML